MTQYFPTIETVFTIHEILVNEMGGSHGLRDAVLCHFKDGEAPNEIRIHSVIRGQNQDEDRQDPQADKT